MIHKNHVLNHATDISDFHFYCIKCGVYFCQGVIHRTIMAVTFSNEFGIDGILRDDLVDLTCEEVQIKLLLE